MMSGKSHRVDDAGRIDRERPIRFTFDGREYTGYVGDTLASALLANDCLLVARSFKYHRPRGIFSNGSEEPCALVTTGDGNRSEPNTRATTVELYDGLVARSQNAWPGLRFDIGAINNLFGRFFSAGFYYKTFMWPGAKGWQFYERFIRRSAGMGMAPPSADPDRYERIEAFCDVLVVGAGPAGLAAAATLAKNGARVIIADEHAVPGGAIARGMVADSDQLSSWATKTIADLDSMDNVTLLRRCTAFGYYDSNVMGLVERLNEHVAEIPAGQARQRHWVVRAREVILATGAIERPMLLADNDLPGIMLSSAAHGFLREFGVCPGNNILIYTNNDSAYVTALALAPHARVTVIDSRSECSQALLDACHGANVITFFNNGVRKALGRRRIRAATLYDGQKVACDALLLAGGWTPMIALHSQAGGKPVFNERLQAFLPGEPREPWLSAGACNGELATADCLQQGQAAAESVLERLGLQCLRPELPVIEADDACGIPGPMPSPDGKCFVDLQNDVTLDDIRQAISEGYASAELLKRYTALGMGTDQGKTSNLNGLAAMAAMRGEAIPAVGVTTFRPPVSPVTMGAIAGRKHGRHISPVRHSPLHAWHEKHGALLSDAGLWKRPLGYPRDGEDRRAAALREAAHVRNAVGCCDVSTLGKIDIQGPDARELLERLYVNRFANLARGKARYGVMLQDDGFVYDDGTTACLGEQRFFMTTTTDHAALVLRNIEFALQVNWPTLRAHACDVTEQWAAIAVAGPRSRDLLEGMFGEAVSATRLPFMGVTDISWQGCDVRVVRISFSGELGYELYTRADSGERLADGLMHAGEAVELVPYGLDAMDILRIEKGHLTGADIDGNRTLDDLGLAAMARNDDRFIGAVLQRRAGLNDVRRSKLVGLQPIDPRQPIVAGAHIVAEKEPREPSVSLGHVSSACYSPTLKREIGLAFVRGGEVLHGHTVHVTNPLAGTHVPVKVVPPHFFDSKGERLRG
jgi:sarcosine oxidase subunit alpha